MNILLDTHIAIWSVEGSPLLAPRAHEMISAGDHDIHVSAVSLWEIAIKHAVKRGGKPAIDLNARAARTAFLAAGFSMLDVTAMHAEAVDDLPFLHADPFDRLLVAQALNAPMRLLTHDAKVAAYSDTIILV